MFRLFPQKKDYLNEESQHAFDVTKPIPQHVAIIMDGNGRWANNRRLPRVAGHKEGMNTVKKITRHASQLGVKVLTLYAFSTENWRRPDTEVNFLMQLPVDFFDEFVPDLIAENVQVKVMGYIEELPMHTKQAVMAAMEQTAHCDGMVLNFALNYGSRAEMLSAVNQLISDAKAGNITDEVSEELFSSYLMTASLGTSYQDPDLLIRTSGEERLSNFLLWQIAYSELYFSGAFWPDFDERQLEKAFASYQRRDRRFGGLNEEKKENEE